MTAKGTEPALAKRDDGDAAFRRLGWLMIALAVLAGTAAWQLVNDHPPHLPTAAELALGLATFLPASFGAAAVMCGEELFR